MHGHANGAITILNATATGIGCSLPVDLRFHATWEPKEDWDLDGLPDDRLVQAVASFLGVGPAKVRVQAPVPPARGLKTSSAVAAALLRAAGSGLEDLALVEACVEVCQAAGVTLTGALDDQIATTLGDCAITDAHEFEVILLLPVPGYAVAIWIPDHDLPKSKLQDVDLRAIEPLVQAARMLAEAGDLSGALTANGAAYTQAYQAAGLPIHKEPADVALAHGALGAGLSGTGPAVAALFDEPVELPPVEGGSWLWTRTLPSGGFA